MYRSGHAIRTERDAAPFLEFPGQPVIYLPTRVNPIPESGLGLAQIAGRRLFEPSVERVAGKVVLAPTFDAHPRI